ncbi:hypothetical protein [Sphaerisporangium fuscum]|uniref:hypothetical protein n=1 Tax=Sphaerisporangium fuscum TaxID=2835868 RepID=UPI001BDBEEE1|nr:hypothetical protein [Sphaerisporangium fuscum]
MNISDLAKVRDEDLLGDPAGRATGPGARALMTAIMAEERVPALSRRRRPRLRRPYLLGSATVALAAAVAIGIGLPTGGPATRYANAAISITKADDDYSITITDPAADPRRIEEAFRAVGVRAIVKMVPAMPAHVGKLYGPFIPESERGRWPGHLTMSPVEPCASAFCATLTMGGGSPDRLVFGIGRPAAPGEPYVEVPPSGTGMYLNALDGYTPDGFKVHGKTVAEVRAELDRRGLKAVYQLWWSYSDNSFFPQPVPADKIKDTWIVDHSRAYSSDTIELFVAPGPEAGPAPASSPSHHWWDTVN